MVDWDVIGPMIEKYKVELRFYEHHLTPMRVVAYIFYRDGWGSDEVLSKATALDIQTAVITCCQKYIDYLQLVDNPDNHSSFCNNESSDNETGRREI